MASQRELAEQLFEAALDLESEERAAFLDRACNGNAELRRDVEALLAADAEAGGFLSHTTEDLRKTLTVAATTVIGPYHLLEVIGEGGMGEVWLAEQKQPVRRRVAIKLIKAGMDTHEVVGRFESERQALALMDHPAIAKVFEAGSTPEGRPYFVMEYAAGIPITAYCDKHKLTVRQRMELFIQVCEGVQHAHQKAIIHRDLKPSNILVIEVDGKPMPRIIDFGVAKAISQKLSASTVYTRVGVLVGTLGYMSPEQAEPIGQDIDTRTDVYSLGAVLYELLTGALPLDLKKLAYDEVLRVLREEDAPRPSTRVTTLGNDSTIAAKNRGSDPPTLARQLRGDPDAIAIKALEKDRHRRYASASELAADIRRYLHSEPVTAHPLSIAYRTRKYLRRYRVGSHKLQRRHLLMALGACVLLAGAGWLAYKKWPANASALPFEHFSIEKAIHNEHLKAAAISPDGKYLASVQRDANGAESLWIHHIPTGSDKAILEEAAFTYRDVIFSPDGNYVYFRIQALGTPPNTRDDLYRIPVFGGQPVRVIEDVADTISFIDGGERVCFYRQTTFAGKVLSASADGGDERVLVDGLVKPYSSACAPNGRLVALAHEDKVEILDFASGSKQTLFSRRPQEGLLDELYWEPSGKGLFAINSTASHVFRQLVFLSYPGGILHPITNDINDYDGISLTADATTIATRQTESKGRFEILSLAQPSRMEEYGPLGLRSFAWLDNEKIVASDEVSALRVVNLIKGETTTLNVAKGLYFFGPSLCGPNTLVATSWTVPETAVGTYKMHLDGSMATQATHGPEDYFPQCTPDGKWLFYGDESHGSRIMRVSLESGVAEEVIEGLRPFSLSLDGKLLAGIGYGRGPNLHIYSTKSLLTGKNLPIPEYVSLVAFALDNKSVFYPTHTEWDTTIWRQPLDSLTPVKVASLPGKIVLSIRSSPDGTKLGLTTATTQSEAVLLRDIR
jgi:serine/threonine protein kinase